MPSLTNSRACAILLSCAIPLAAAGPWQNLLDSVGISPAGIQILEGASPQAEALGIHATGRTITIQSITDLRNPKLPIVWQRAVQVPFFTLPPRAITFAKERHQNAPVMAGFRMDKTAVLWLATSPGEKGYERYPYILQALTDLGVAPRLRSSQLWAFFDSSYRTRVDLDYFAARWRKAGIGALQVAAWHFNEPDPARDEYLRKLIAACHKHAILVYAWLELPHVSEEFWSTHPEWREKTGLLQDAHLDWRKLMNLNNPACFNAAAAETRALIHRFDWDGVNLAELYFESLDGAANPARFTPLNDDVRNEYKKENGLDPIDLWKPENAAAMKDFLDYRANLARKMQTRWMSEIESIRNTTKPNLDLVLTHVDDRFDTRMRDLIGADAARVLPMLDTHDFTFLIEDPATIWNLGPERYPQIAQRYEPLTKHREKLAIDINIVERYQDVYPTKQQTGAELFQLVHLAAQAFPRVALYFENSILSPDLQLLPSAAAVVTRYEESNQKTIIDSPQGVGLVWTGPAAVDGKPWPVADSTTVWLPPGSHTVEPAVAHPAIRLVDFNGTLKTAASLPDGLEFDYKSSARAIAILDTPPQKVEIDGAPTPFSGATLLLPRGPHKIKITIPAAPSRASNLEINRMVERRESGQINTRPGQLRQSPAPLGGERVFVQPVRLPALAKIDLNRQRNILCPIRLHTQPEAVLPLRDRGRLFQPANLTLRPQLLRRSPLRSRNAPGRRERLVVRRLQTLRHEIPAVSIPSRLRLTYPSNSGRFSFAAITHRAASTIGLYCTVLRSSYIPSASISIVSASH